LNNEHPNKAIRAESGRTDMPC